EAEVEQTRSHLAAELAELQEGREALLRAAREELDEELAEVRRALREASRRAERGVPIELPTAQEAVQAAEAQIKQLRRRAPARPAAGPAAILPEQIRAGDLISIRGLDRAGEAVAAADDRGEVEVQLGALRTRVKL